jgi:hypothetical protein
MLAPYTAGGRLTLLREHRVAADVTADRVTVVDVNFDRRFADARGRCFTDAERRSCR